MTAPQHRAGSNRMGLVEHFRDMALNNAWSNRRLLAACAGLGDAAFAATRTSFFPSLSATLNHILIVDWYYIDALEGGSIGYAIFDNEIPHPKLPGLAEAQVTSDRRLIAFCERLGESDLGRRVILDRAERGRKEETVGTVLPHLFIHQIHHRGQAHAMLSGTTVKPPQLDEFFLLEDRAATVPELASMGLSRG
jgi:uncharacterized damage-inducible protein DinB